MQNIVRQYDIGALRRFLPVLVEELNQITDFVRRFVARLEVEIGHIMK